MSAKLTSDRLILICQGRSCRKDGSRQVLEAFQSLKMPDVSIIPSGCLGKCGNGPNVLFLPEETWYQRVKPEEVYWRFATHQ